MAGLPGSKGENNQRAPARAPKTSCKPRLKDRIWRGVGMVRKCQNDENVGMNMNEPVTTEIDMGEDYFSGFYN